MVPLEVGEFPADVVLHPILRHQGSLELKPLGSEVGNQLECLIVQVRGSTFDNDGNDKDDNDDDNKTFKILFILGSSMCLLIARRRGGHNDSLGFEIWDLGFGLGLDKYKYQNSHKPPASSEKWVSDCRDPRDILHVCCPITLVPQSHNYDDDDDEKDNDNSLTSWILFF